MATTPHSTHSGGGVDAQTLMGFLEHWSSVAIQTAKQVGRERSN